MSNCSIADLSFNMNKV